MMSHRERLALAIERDRARRGVAAHVVEAPDPLPMPTLTEDSPDLNVYDITEHKRWRWSGPAWMPSRTR